MLVIGLVGLSVICLGLMVILFLAMLRFTGHHMLGFFTFWGRGGDNDKDDGTSFIPSAKPDLRSIAKAQDFDTALAKHIVQDEIEPHSSQHASGTPSAFTTSPALPPAAPFPDAAPRLGSRGSNGRVHHTGNGSRADDDEEDDALADFLDEG
ncbi:MAG: hypothetical protein ABI700_05745 [Chloroflexota bacterium]